MKKSAIVVFIFLCAFNHVQSGKVRYDKFQVYRIIPKTEQNVRDLRIIEESNHGFTFWKSASGVGKNVDIMVPSHLKQHLQESLAVLNMESTIFIDDVQKLIENEQAENKSLRFDWTDYQDLTSINTWLQELATQYPGVVTLLNIGTTYEGRDILGVHVNFNPDSPQKTVFIEANIHAREWITSAVATYFLNELLTSTNSTIRTLAESRDWYIFPVVNPDGFQYNHSTDRLWRKTRNHYGFCFGADANRNWDFHYGEEGSDISPCSELYRGPHAFSEPSMKSLSDFISTIGPNLEAYIALHSYSQLLMAPYAHTGDHLDNYDTLLEVGLKAAESLAQRFGTQYTVGSWYDTLYVSSGISVDWVKGNFGTPITYTYELRDTGAYGFLLPADQILPTSIETTDSLITIFAEFDIILSK